MIDGEMIKIRPWHQLVPTHRKDRKVVTVKMASQKTYPTSMTAQIGTEIPFPILGSPV